MASPAKRPPLLMRVLDAANFVSYPLADKGKEKAVVSRRWWLILTGYLLIGLIIVGLSVYYATRSFVVTDTGPAGKLLKHGDPFLIGQTLVTGDCLVAPSGRSRLRLLGNFYISRISECNSIWTAMAPLNLCPPLGAYCTVDDSEFNTTDYVALGRWIGTTIFVDFNDRFVRTSNVWDSALGYTFEKKFDPLYYRSVYPQLNATSAIGINTDGVDCLIGFSESLLNTTVPPSACTFMVAQMDLPSPCFTQNHFNWIRAATDDMQFLPTEDYSYFNQTISTLCKSWTETTFATVTYTARNTWLEIVSLVTAPLGIVWAAMTIVAVKFNDFVAKRTQSNTST